MRALLLCLALALALPAHAQTRIGADGNLKLDVGAVAEEVLRLYNEVDEDQSFRYLDATIREARGKGWLGDDAGVLFAMYADALRNMRANPAYSMRIAEEGLALVQSGAFTDPRDVMALEVSRAYALADMGRFDEAVAAATLSIPMLREHFGAQAADDLAGYVVEWQAGRMSAFNESAMDLARKALERAEEAIDRSDHATVLAEASRAMLPPGSGFAAADLALLNAEARTLAGRALYLMQRRDEAMAMLSAGAEALYGPGWATRPDAAPLAPVPEDTRHRIAELFYWLSRVALDARDRPLTEAALTVADRYAPGTDWPDTLLLIWIQLAVMDSDHARVDALTDRVVAASRAEGNEDFARMAEFYRATAHASIVPTWDDVDIVAILHSARGALEYAVPGSSIDPGHILGELAQFLMLTGNPGAGIAASRDAVNDEMMRRGGRSGPEGEAHAKRMRMLAEMHLFAAHELDSRSPDAFCFETDGRGCVIWVNRE